MNKIERAIPEHKRGIRKNFTANRKFVTVEDAKLCYDNAIARMLAINNWYQISPATEGSFQLMSGSRKPQRRKAKLNDYVRIGIPGPENADGAGFDWVSVHDLRFSTGRRKEQCLMTLIPCAMPGGQHTAHFFGAGSSSSFLLTRDGHLVTAEYFGHNELPNADTKGWKETIRNVAVAAGAVIGVSETLWAPLMEGLLMDGARLREKKAAAKVQQED